MKTPLALVALLLLGCAVSRAPIESDNTAKVISPPEGKALVYFLRPSLFGSAMRGSLICDNQYLGSIAGFRYIYTIQNAGKHTFTSLTQNKSNLNVELLPDKTYYIRQDLSFGISNANKDLTLLSEASGKSMLAKCRLSADCVELEARATR